MAQTWEVLSVTCLRKWQQDALLAQRQIAAAGVLPGIGMKPSDNPQITPKPSLFLRTVARQ